MPALPRRAGRHHGATSRTRLSHWQAAASFCGARPSYTFKLGPNGLGYYLVGAASCPSRPPHARHATPRHTDYACRPSDATLVPQEPRALHHDRASSSSSTADPDAPSKRRKTQPTQGPAPPSGAWAGRLVRCGYYEGDVFIVSQVRRSTCDTFWSAQLKGPYAKGTYNWCQLSVLVRLSNPSAPAPRYYS